MLDDAKANIDDIMVVHRVACSAGVVSSDEEAHCEGLETFGGMPGGGHSLPIFLAIYGCGTPVLCDEPVEHVQKDSVWLLHVDRLVCFTNCFGWIRKEDIGEGHIHCDDVRLSFLITGMCCLDTFALIVGCTHGEVWNIINFLGEEEVA